MSNATVAQFEKNPAAFIEAAEQGQTVVVLRKGRRVARLTPEPAIEKRSTSRKVSKAELDAWIERERPFFDSMGEKVHGKSAVRTLKESRR